MAKRTKIVCTIGPASESPTVLTELLKAGMNVARLNFSHGSYDNHRLLIKNIRAAALKVKKPVAILQDLQGPRIRLGIFDGEIDLKRGAKIILVSQSVFKKSSKKTTCLPVQLPQIFKFLKPGQKIFIKDGLIELRVIKFKSKDQSLVAKVSKPGRVSSLRGMNFPGAFLGIPAVTAKDHRDAEFGLSVGVDWLALSFVQRASDITDLRKFLSRRVKAGQTVPKIMAKIETTAAVKNIDSIIKAADGIMIARGDLGIELPVSALPILQKDFIKKCLAADRPVIVATQMLESMMVNPRPTRAEITDVANAVIDHTDATMLSGETASGQYPVEAVRTMKEIIVQIEQSSYDDVRHKPALTNDPLEATAGAVSRLAIDSQATAVVIFDQDGRLARAVAASRLELPVFACTNNKALANQLVLSWGVNPRLINKLPKSGLDGVKQAKILLTKEKLSKNGQVVVVAIQTKGDKKRNIVEVVEI